MTTPLLEQMLTHLFDYAGTFPPASLSLEAALETARSFPRSLRRPHLLAADLVVTLEAAQTLLARYADTLRSWTPKPFTICLLGGAEETGAERGFIQDLQERPDQLMRVASLEVRLGATVCGDLGRLSDCLDRLEADCPNADLLLAIEPDLSAGEISLVRVCDVLSSRKSPWRIALKVRGGGPAPISPDLLARVIEEVSRRKLLLKATAGMHHPVLEPERYGNQHGFLNVLVALMLCRNLAEFDSASLRECLGNRDANAFAFDRELRWQNYSVPSAVVVETLSRFPLRIGSCSLHEPDEDLQRFYPVPGGAENLK